MSVTWEDATFENDEVKVRCHPHPYERSIYGKRILIYTDKKSGKSDYIFVDGDVLHTLQGVNFLLKRPTITLTVEIVKR